MNVGELLADARGQLAEQAEARLEAEILLGEALGVNRAWLYANPEHCPQPGPVSRFKTLVRRRIEGEPIAYLTGHREFWSFSLEVTPGVLIPRPETELLVTTVLSHIPAGANWRVADLGTGSGAIALALAIERPGCDIHATDISETALEVAALNMRRLAPGRVRFHRGCWLAALTGKFHVIASNPPYIAESDPHLARGDCRFEPATALAAGPDGLAAIRQIIREAAECLEPGGMLVFEHGFDQGQAVRILLSDRGFEQVTTEKDLEGRERVTSAIRF